MNNAFVFPAGLFVFSGACAFAAYWVFGLDEKNLQEREKIARDRLFGVILAAAGFFWCIPHSKPLLSNHMHGYLLPAAVICTWIAFMFLDFLFTRALGGILILSAHFFLYESFAAKAFMSPFFSALCFLMGIFALFLCGKPYLLRDIIRKFAASRRWKYSGAAILIFYSVTAMAYGIFSFASSAPPR